MTVRFRQLVFLFGYLVVAVSNATAHELDEYVQSTLVDVTRNAFYLSVNLEPGSEIADQVLNLIDSDRNGVISADEWQAAPHS